MGEDIPFSLSELWSDQFRPSTLTTAAPTTNQQTDPASASAAIGIGFSNSIVCGVFYKVVATVNIKKLDQIRWEKSIYIEPGKILFFWIHIFLSFEKRM